MDQRAAVCDAESAMVTAVRGAACNDAVSCRALCVTKHLARARAYMLSSILALLWRRKTSAVDRCCGACHVLAGGCRGTLRADHAADFCWGNRILLRASPPAICTGGRLPTDFRIEAAPLVPGAVRDFIVG